ncbi:MAG: C4-type zinc ribbon domain-containing protein [Spirochaetales bacterium]|jgi:predicted  nucleic acid-binding Zn-ribbon protein|nr:C4-type zinc ribbon domain-containing protein [Spirochaetales bacterium]
MMIEVFEKLKVLQNILSKKYEVERDISELPKSLSTKADVLNRLQKSYVEKNEHIKESRERIENLKVRLTEAGGLRETYEKQMDLIKTQREYEALDKEIRDAMEREQQIRKDLLNEEKDLSELLYSFESEEALIQEQEEELKNEEAKINKVTEEKLKVLERLKNEEAEVIPGLDEDILFKFERIIKNKSGIGIVPVRRSICSGCHMIFPVQFQNEVRQGDKILFCPYCSRILYYEESTPEDEEIVVAFNDEDFGHFADEEDD